MVVNIQVDSDELLKELREAPDELKKAVAKKFREKTRELKAEAKRTAPRSSGKLSRAIFGRTFSKSLKSEIGIPEWLNSAGSGFNYGDFVTGQTKINIAKPNKYFMVGQTVRYGFPAVSPAGNPIRWSANPGWWDRIEFKAQEEYPEVAREAINNFTKEF